MAQTVVIYHSGYGHTQRVAQFVAQGANAALIAIDADGNIADSDWAALDAADAIIFGSPTYMGMASWQFKKFADASSKRCKPQWRQAFYPPILHHIGHATSHDLGGSTLYE